MDAHPATSLFPMMSDDDLSELASDIAAHGLMHPVVLHEGMVLDGRNRLKACELAGVKASFITWEAHGASPTEWVIATNLHRRHLTASQRAAIAVEALPMLEAEARKRQGQRTDLHPTSVPIGTEVPTQAPIRSREIAAQQFNVGTTSITRAKFLRTHHPEEFQQVKEGKKTLFAATTAVGYESQTKKPGEGRKEAGTKATARRTNEAQMARVMTPTAMQWARVRQFVNEQLLPLDPNTVAACFCGDDAAKAKWTIQRCLEWFGALSEATEKRAHVKNPTTERIAD